MKKLILPKSLSELAYAAPWAKSALAGVLVLGAVGLWIGATQKVSDDWLWLAWLTAVSVVFVAAIPLTDKGFTGVHVAAAVLACVTVTALAVVTVPLAVSVWVGYVAYTLLSDCEYKKLVAELCCVAEALAVVLKC